MIGRQTVEVLTRVQRVHVVDLAEQLIVATALGQRMIQFVRCEQLMHHDTLQQNKGALTVTEPSKISKRKLKAWG